MAKEKRSSEPEAASPWRAPAAVIVIAVLVPLLNATPTLDGYFRQSPPDRIFMGFRHMAGDHFQYASFVRQVADEGRVLMENRFTTEPQRPSYFFLYFWIVGTICRYTGLGLIPVWELMRLLVGFAFLLTAWRFTALFFREHGERLLAYALIAFSGGIAWVVRLVRGDPPITSLMSTLKDPFNFQWNWSTFSAMLVPFWVAPALVLLLCLLVLSREKPIDPIARWATGLTLPLVIWFLHPHTGLIAYLAFGLYVLTPAAASLWRLDPIPRRETREHLLAALPFLLSFAGVAAYLMWARQDPVFTANSRQGFVWTPVYSVFLYPFTYGLPLPLAILGMRWSAALPIRARRVLFALLASSFILSTNPFFAGTKYQYVMHVPLAILAAHGLLELRRRSERVRALTRGFGAAVLGAALFLNPPLTLLKDMPKTATDKDIYLSRAEIEAMRFLSSQPPGSVLCSTRPGGRIPWLSGKTAYVGHWLMTVDIGAKEQYVMAFLNPEVSADAKRAFLRRNEIRYVYAGPDEKRAGQVDSSLGLETIYDREGVTIYRIP